MSLTEKNIVKEYIQLKIEEKVENRPNSNHLEIKLNKKISKKKIEEDSKKIIILKKEIDDLITKSIGSYENINDLKDPSKKTEIINSIYDEIGESKIKEFKNNLEIIDDLEKIQNDDMNFDANLILSTIFNPEKKEDINESVVIENPRLKKKDMLNISKIKIDYRKINFRKLNSKKILTFFEMMKNYNFDINFSEKDKKLFEGALTLIINSNEKSLNNFIFKDYFQNFVEKFTNFFIEDFEAQIENFYFDTSPLTILLCSYNKNLCQFMENRCFLENLCEKINDLKKEDLHFYLKIFINLLKNHGNFFKKFLILKIIDKFFTFLKDDEDLNTLSMFLILLNKLGEFKLNPKKYISVENQKILFKKISKLFEDDKIKVLSYKLKNTITKFLPNHTTDSYLLIKLFIDQNKEVIKEVLPIEYYETIHFIALLLLNFFAQNKKMIPESNYERIVDLTFFLTNNFYYLAEIVFLGFSSFHNFLNKTTYKIFMEEFENSEILYNVISVFERAPITEELFKHIELIQDFLLNLLDISILKCLGVSHKIKHLLIEYVYKIKKIVENFHFSLKKKYLKKGLVKYITKLNQQKENMESSIEMILSKNGLILKKLEDDNLLEGNIKYLTKIDKKLTFIIISEGNLDKLKIIEILESAKKAIYLTSKIDKENEFKTMMGFHSIFMMDKINDFINYLLKNKIDVNFEIMKNLLEYIILDLYYVKTYDENFSTTGSKKIFDKSFNIFKNIFFNIKHFVDLNSNFELYIFLENFNHFWFAYFGFDYKFYDRINNFFFLNSIPEKNNSTISNNFNENSVKNIINFLNELVDLKSKCPFINFIILKQIDIIYNTFDNFSKLNRQFLINIFQKSLDFSYSSDIHKIDTEFFFNLSVKILSIPEIQGFFMDFIYQNNLYINDFIMNLVKNSLDKNYKIENIKNLTEDSKDLLEYKIFGKDLPDKSEFTKFLFYLAQTNIRNKNLFQDVILLIKKYFQKYPNDYNKNLAQRLLINSGIYLKLMKLYKKDKVNLSKTLKNFLKINKIFNLHEDTNLPDNLIKNILKIPNIFALEDVYTQILDYIVNKGIYEDFEKEIKIYLTNAKSYLDKCLFFLNNKFSYERNIKSIYYCLKTFSRASNLADSLINIDSNEFVVKYILQIFEENYKFEFNKENNLYFYFTNYETEKDKNKKTIKFEKKIIALLLEILQNGNYKELQKNDYLLNKIIKFCQYLIDSYPIEKYQKTYLKFLILNLKNETEDKQIFHDFYMIMYNTYNLESNDAKKLFENQFLIENDVIKTFDVILRELKKVPEIFDPLSYNTLIRNLLKTFYIINTAHSHFQQETYLSIVKTLDNYMKNYYNEISKIEKLEKLIIEIYIIINKHKNTNSLSTSNVFLNIFIHNANFYVGAHINKYIYMGLFNSFFKKYRRKNKWILNRATLEYYLKNELRERIMEKYNIFKIDENPLNLIVKQLNIRELDKSHELLICRFLKNISFFKKNLVTNLEFDDEILDLKIEQTIEQLENLETLEPQFYEVFIRRIEVIVYIVDKMHNEEDKDKLDLFFTKMTNLINKIVENVESINVIKTKGITKTIKRLFLTGFFRLIKKIYYLATVKINSSIKNLLLNTLSHFFISSKEKVIENNLMILINSYLIYISLKLMRNKYDEVRICQNKELKNHILKAFITKIFRKDSMELKVEGSVKTENNTEMDLSKIEIRELEFSKDFKLNNYVELSLFAFVQFVKNPLLLEEEEKVDTFYRIEENIERFQVNDITIFLFQKLEEEFKKDGMILRHEQDTISTLDLKKKNILYVSKMMNTINSNLEKNGELSDQEKKFLSFSIEALNLHLDENLDSEIFTKFGFVKLLCNFFVHEKIEMDYKLKIIQILRDYMHLTKYNSKIQYQEIQSFFNYYTILLITPELNEIARKYFIVAELIINYSKIDVEFMNQYFNELSEKIFGTKVDISEQVFIGSLFVYTTTLKVHDITFNFDKISNIIYNFLKVNHKRMQLEEKALFAEVLMHLRKKATNLDELKYRNMVLFLKLKYLDQSYRQVKRVNKSIKNIVEMADDYQDMLRDLGFELYFKLIMKKFGKNQDTAVEIGHLFLTYTYKINKNRFDMFETLKSIMDYIEFFYMMDNKELVVIFYKCLCNASLVKQNAEFLIKNKIYMTIKKCFYTKDVDFYYIIISLIFNISYILNEDEIDIKELLNDDLLRIIINIYDDALENKYTNILDQLIDIFISFVQHHSVDLFDRNLLSKIKLTLNFYYRDESVLIRYLTIIKDLTISKNKKVENIITNNFDFLYLYHIHFRHINNSKINSLIKHITYNILTINDEKNTENDLILFGIPENVVHTFSFDDDEDTSIVNLKIILYSLKFDKCLIYINNYFLSSLRVICYQEHKNITDKILFLGLDIMYEMLQFFRSPEIMNAYFFFDRIDYMFEMVEYYKNHEKYLYVTLKLIKNYLEHNKKAVEEINQRGQDNLKAVIANRNNIKDVSLIAEIYDINNMIHYQKTVMEDKYDIFTIKGDVTTQDKMMIDRGEYIILLHENVVHKRAFVKYDFLSNSVNIMNISYKDKADHDREKTEFIINVKKIDKVDQFNDVELNSFEESFKTFFNKEIDRSLFFNIKFWVLRGQDVIIETVYLIFENEFKGKKWNKLIHILADK